MIDRDHQLRPGSADRPGEGAQLRRLGIVAGKQDDAADKGMLQDLPLFGGDLVGSHVEHDGAGKGRR